MNAIVEENIWKTYKKRTETAHESRYFRVSRKNDLNSGYYGFFILCVICFSCKRKKESSKDKKET